VTVASLEKIPRGEESCHVGQPATLVEDRQV